MTPVVSALIGALSGLILHHTVFIHGEWHVQAPDILIYHLVCLVALFMAFNHACWMIFGYLIALFSSITVYRVYFHRLRNFPGPRWARVTKIWHAWQSRHRQNFLVLSELHRKYGDFVRTGMIELHSSLRTHSNYLSTQVPARSQSTTRMFSWLWMDLKAAV